ncbi:DUF4434 domain-containing protein [Pseudovibrio sp. Tun.PSC04-5.I4]|uniref:DUF4434 domain-containing protein n=1 Tax=Pseudovibrio sp. Tun.PSC04-5.I4 TaxID=1798213 RepID=UPI0008845EC4|nr:DUF4434 domain-containing protein [Pseudovibrio sp. Tun.PSC04-5.I4]SDR03145.1 protein of unknown function [Pseudovibrio sp. Tun.PSC04-5.I4]
MTAKPAEYFWVFKQTFKQLILWGLCLGILTIVMMLKAYARPDSGVKECIPIRMSFIQPWGDEYIPNQRIWRSELLSHQRLGVDEIILQWTLWSSDHSTEPKLPIWLESAILAADDAGTKIWFGLRYDPGFIKGLRTKGQAYLDQRLSENRALAKAIKSQLAYASHPDQVFAGWYIADEIDSELLLDAKLNTLITSYVKRTRIALNEILPGPVAISGYTGMETNAEKLAARWNTLMNASSLDILLLQDGLGAKLMEPYSSRNLQRSINAAFQKQDHTVIPVVEIFEIDPRTPDFKTMPTKVGTMKRRLSNARIKPDQSVALFSLSSHVLKHDSKDSRDLAKFLQQNAQICQQSELKVFNTQNERD